MDLIFELPIEIDAESRRASTHSVYSLLKQAILSGHLPAGTKLPPTRLAGRHFRLSRNSIVPIYDRLVAEGLVVARRGAGTFVAPKVHVSSAAPRRTNAPSALTSRIRPTWSDGEIVERLKFWDRPEADCKPLDSIDLRICLIDQNLFPYDQFRRCMVKTLRQIERSPPPIRSPQGNQGSIQLRHAIADHVALMRAMVCRPEDIVVTTSAQQALELVASVFVEPGKTVVAVEDPGSPPLRTAFMAAGAIVRSVPVDRGGMMIEMIPHDVKIICVGPSNQFPLGVTMPAHRRRQLYEFAKEHHALIVEDDYDAELRIDGEPLKAIYSQEAAELVFYIGTLSKCMLPVIGLAYMIVPAWARDAIVLAKNCTEWNSPTLTELAAARFLSEGYMSAHVARMRTAYRARRSEFIRVLSANFGTRLRPFAPNYGLHLAAVGSANVDWDAVSLKAGEAGVTVHSLTRFYSSETPLPGLLFGIGGEPVERLKLGLDRLESIVPG